MNLNMMNQPVNMTIGDIYHVMYVARKENSAKVSLHVSNGVRFLCIHKGHIFSDVGSALSYLREDARNIVAPELRNKIKIIGWDLVKYSLNAAEIMGADEIDEIEAKAA